MEEFMKDSATYSLSSVTITKINSHTTLFSLFSPPRNFLVTKRTKVEAKVIARLSVRVPLSHSCSQHCNLLLSKEDIQEGKKKKRWIPFYTMYPELEREPNANITSEAWKDYDISSTIVPPMVSRPEEELSPH